MSQLRAITLFAMIIIVVIIVVGKKGFSRDVTDDDRWLLCFGGELECLEKIENERVA
jgi:hypothetical protein